MKRTVLVKCWDPECKFGTGHFLFLSGKLGKYVTYICEHQKQFSTIVDGDAEYWSDEILIRAYELRESGHDYARTTTQLNKEFGTKFSGIQRPDGKGYRGAVSRKFARLTKCEWNETDSDQMLIALARTSLAINKERKNSEQLGRTIPLKDGDGVGSEIQK